MPFTALGRARLYYLRNGMVREFHAGQARQGTSWLTNERKLGNAVNDTLLLANWQARSVCVATKLLSLSLSALSKEKFSLENVHD